MTQMLSPAPLETAEYLKDASRCRFSIWRDELRNAILLILLQVAHVIVGLVLPVVLVGWLRKPRGWWSRAGVTTVVCWVWLILLATLQHYSVGNTDLLLRSGDNHEAVADRGWSIENNQILFMLVTGWAMPAMMLLAVALHRWLMHDDATS